MTRSCLSGFLLALLFSSLISDTAHAGRWPYPPKLAGAKEEVYREVGDTKLKVWIFEPKGKSSTPRPAVVFFFGGGWIGGSPMQFEDQCRHFAELGMVAMTADYRVSSRQKAKPTDCVTDAKACVAWIRKNATRLGIDPEKIAAAGGSAGGHVAACTGTVPGFGSDEHPNAMILFNPGLVMAPWQGHRFEGFGSNITDEKRGAKAEAISPIHHIDKDTPPTLIFHGTKDSTVPYATVEAFTKAMKNAGRTCQLVGFEGEGHAFFNKDPIKKQTLDESDHFLRKLGWVK